MLQKVLNRFGNSIGSHTAEYIETEIASKIVQEGNILQTCYSPKLVCAWDNYDELTEIV